MRRLRSAIAVVVALALLGGAAWFGDRWARGEVEARVEEQVRQQLLVELPGSLGVDVGGRFVIPQLVAGSLEEVRLTASEATIDGFTVTDVVVVAEDVALRGDGGAGAVTATGTAPTHAVVAAVQQRVDLPDGVAIELRDGEIAVTGSVLGLVLEAYVRPVAGPRSISFEIARFVLGGATVDAADIPIDLDALLADATVSLDQLAAGVELTELVVTPDGVDLVLTGTDVRL